MELTLEKLLELAKISVQRSGAKIVMIDPWNELSHIRNSPGESETEYTGRAIRMLKRFAKINRILLIIVAHPSKAAIQDKGPMNLYQVNGSAHWANKSDYGVIIYREDVESTNTTVIFAKIKRHGAMGHIGEIHTSFDARTRRFNETGG
jgi:twinkle protein